MTPSPSPKWVCALIFIALLTMALSTLMADDSSRPPWIAPSRAARKKNPIPADDKSIAAGKTLYIAQCLKCHGDTGKGDGPSAKDLDVKPKDLSDPAIAGQTDGALYWKITSGRKPMPSFENLISDDDRWNVVNYIRTLEPASATQPSSR